MTSPAFRRGEHGIYFINPPDREERHGRHAPQRFLLWFGACAPTLLMVWERHLEDALETAADWLADNTPGHLMTEDSEEMADLRREACEEAGLPWPPECDHEMEELGYYDTFESAEADLTYTESGYLTSYEWGIVAENPDRATVLDVQASRMVDICERRELPKPKSPAASAAR